MHENNISLVIEPVINNRGVVPTPQPEVVAAIDTSDGVVSGFPVCAGQGVEISGQVRHSLVGKDPDFLATVNDIPEV